MKPLNAPPAKAATIALRLGAAILATLLASCGSANDPDICPGVGENYLQDADFALEQQNPRSKHWTSSQHAGENSFSMTIENGELTIAKIGSQDWGVFRQKLRSSELGGARMMFAAEIKLDLGAEGVRAFPVGGGLSMIARSGRNRILLKSVLNHEPRLGKTEWQKVWVIVDVPDRTQVVDLGFLHQASGVLQVRKPSFHRVNATSAACAVTPDLYAKKS